MINGLTLLQLLDNSKNDLDYGDDYGLICMLAEVIILYKEETKVNMACNSTKHIQ